MRRERRRVFSKQTAADLQVQMESADCFQLNGEGSSGMIEKEMKFKDVKQKCLLI